MRSAGLRKRSRCFRGWIRDGIGPGEAWLTNITTCHTSKSGARCHQSRTLPAVSSSMVASVLTVHVMLHMANAIRPPQTVDRTLQFFPKICQLIHSPPPIPAPPCLDSSPLAATAAEHNTSPLISGTDAAATLISNNISSSVKVSQEWSGERSPRSHRRVFARPPAQEELRRGKRHDTFYNPRER